MANEENLKPFEHGYDPRREGNGRPKGSKSAKTIFRELLASQDPDGEWARPVAAKIIQKGFRGEGDLAALKEILDRTEGKIPQPLQGEGFASNSYVYIVKDGKTAGRRDGNRVALHSARKPADDTK